MSDKLEDEVVENRERLQRFEDNPIKEVQVDFASEEVTTDTKSITAQSTTVKEIVENGTVISSETVSDNQLSSVYLRNLLIGMLIGTDATEAISNHRFGTGDATSDGTDRRSVQSLQTDETSNLNTNLTITVNSNSIEIDETITNIEDVSFGASDISEVAIESDAGNLFQYITDN